MAHSDDQTDRPLPSKIWTVEDYYRVKDFYDKRGLIFNPALEYGSPAANHIVAQAQLRAMHGSSEPFRSSTCIIRDKLFISYSHQDKKFLDQLLTHLKPLERAGKITVWSDKEIEPGAKWFTEIEEALRCTKVAFLLVTKDFLASDFIHKHELAPLLKESEKGTVQILWVMVRACQYKATSIKDIQAILPPDKPLADMRAERDRAWVTVCEAIEKALSSN